MGDKLEKGVFHINLCYGRSSKPVLVLSYNKVRQPNNIFTLFIFVSNKRKVID